MMAIFLYIRITFVVLVGLTLSVAVPLEMQEVEARAPMAQVIRTCKQSKTAALTFVRLISSFEPKSYSLDVSIHQDDGPSSYV